ncbi:MAG: DNA translocase FtsK, partial [Anaerolineae bacterium]|nr:DNA translocase FtsK [Anaerolineae bacterium]
DYNQEAGEIAVPYHVLVAFDFPTNFSDSALQYLVSIVRNGPRCGVHTILVIDPHTPLPHGFDLQTVEENAIVLHGSEVGVVLRDDDYPSCTIQMATPPTGKRFNQILKKIGQGALAASCVQVPFARIAPEASKWWAASAESGLRVAVGTTGARSLQRVDLGSGTAQHVLVAGKTGAGKSTMLHVLITNLALTYSPWEVQLYLVDFKKGVEFKAYASSRNWILPHARVVAIESEREFGLSVLKALDEELKTRGDAFRKAGVDSLAAYRQRTEQRLPRLLLIVDEFQEFFAEDDKVSAQAKLILDRLIRQGRAFGMHVLLGSQTLAGAYALSRSTTDQMAVRIALQCSDIDSRLILADDNPAARRLSRPGEAIYNDANGFLEGNSLFQVAWLPDDERGHYLAGVQELVKQHGYSTEAKPIVFEGGKRVTLVDNSSMARLLARPSWPPPSEARVAWVGEPVAIRPPVHIPFAREAGRNVLVVGQDMESALGMFASAILSLAAQHAPDAAAFQLFDYSPLNADHDDLFARLMHALPHDSICARRRDVELSVTKIADEVNRRLDMEEEAIQKTPTWYLFVFGIQAARELRAADQYGLSSFRPLEEQPPSAGAQFLRILQEGPALGIHTVIWADNCHNLNRIVDRRNMHEFGLRVTMQMSPEDSSLIIDSTAASKLGLHRALLYFEGAGGLEKFLPYEAPDDRWVQWVGARLRAKAGR